MELLEELHWEDCWRYSCKETDNEGRDHHKRLPRLAVGEVIRSGTVTDALRAPGNLLDWLPCLLLKASVNGLGDGGLHQVNVADNQGHEDLLQVLVEFSITQKG